ncbi:MAG: Acyl-CoA dehydrogenase [Pseudomonadota bacterium]|jgi:alkylation response protein AidB-like acyl-CoA dehydrogenase|nr:acyl-CoA dehydrogenase [Limnohabitans sp.]
MSHYQPNIQDMQFVLSHVLNVSDQLKSLPVFEELEDELVQQVLDEAGKFVGEVVAPLNRDGDEIGAQWQDGKVTMPPGFQAAYQMFWQAGWPALSADTEHGGQGLPTVLEIMLYEMLSAANHGWTMAPGLLHGAYECIKHYASPSLKETYLSKVGTGEWLATMCLTEPHAGSDLGLSRTKATPQADGRYTLNGTKIFISGGEHDLTDNIVHLVLARLPDAPPGPKGLSLFLVPKFYPNGERSAVHCDRIEEKMGLHGSPTCVMRFEDALAEIIGEPGKGLNAMFVMMNAARLHVAMQGIGLLDAAWQKANAYAKERRQMRAPASKQRKAKSAAEADFIIEHPAIRRILDTQRSWVDGGRVLAYQTAIELDRIKHADKETADRSQRWCALVTPVMKAAFTHQAFHGGSDCLQVLGGHGYVREWGIEQIVRDARVAMIYEGTNEIQAIDLLVRKIMTDGGQSLNQLLDDMKAETQIETAEATQLRKLTQNIWTATQLDPSVGHRVADDYLRAMALVLLQWAWQRIDANLDQDSPELKDRWQSPSKAFRQWVLPEFAMRSHIIEAQCAAS